MVVDVVRLGKGLRDRLREQGWRVLRFHGSAAPLPKAEQRFLNRRAELYWQLRERFERGAIAIPNDPLLIEELLATDYEIVDSSGKIALVPKAEIRAPGPLARPRRRRGLRVRDDGRPLSGAPRPARLRRRDHRRTQATGSGELRRFVGRCGLRQGAIQLLQPILEMGPDPPGPTVFISAGRGDQDSDTRRHVHIYHRAFFALV